MHGTSRRVAATCSATLGIALLLGILLRAASSGEEAAPTTLEITLAGLSSSLALGAFALAGALAQPGDPLHALGLRRPALSLSGWQVAALIVGLVGCSHLVYVALSLTPLYDMSVLDTLERGLRGARGPALALAIVGIAIAPAVCEELLFRGLLLRGIARRWGGGAAILVSSSVFAALHLDPVQGPGAFVLGLYLGATALASGGTRVPILCHMANNLAAVAAAVAGTGEFSTVTAGTLALASLGAASLGVAVLHRAARPRDPSAHETA